MGLVLRWLLLVAVLGSSCNGCRVFEHPLGTVTDDHDLATGSTLTFRCTLNNKTVEEKDITSSDIILKVQKNILNGARVLDRNSVEYTLQNATPEDSGLYSCFVPLRNFSSPQLVCSSYIAVGYKPTDVLNFTCISHGYSNLTCTWVAPFNPVSTTYVLYDFLYNHEVLKRKCPVLVSSGCQFRLDTKPAYIQSQEFLNFIVIGNNSLGTSKQYFKLRHMEIIKPGLPHTTTEDVSRTSLVLRLRAPQGLQNGEFSGGLMYSVRYYSISTKLDVYRTAIVEADSNAILKIENLVPDTQYRFEVQCRLSFIGDSFHWSDTYNTTETTLPDVPYLAPVIDNSAFDTQPIAGNRTITLYWKAVPSEFENGNDLHYIVKYHEHYVPKRSVRQIYGRLGNNVRVGNRTYYTFEHMDTNTAYMFNIIACNSIGCSTNETGIIVVDKADKFLQGPKDITVVSYDQGSYDISWRSPFPTITNYTLFWCETLRVRPARCDGQLEWATVVNETSHKLYLPSNSTNYQFAVASVQGRKTSGMVWAPCTVVYGVTYKIRKIELVPKNSTSLKIRWSLKCEAEKKIIKEYAVYYCPYEGVCSHENARNCKVNGLGVMDWPHQKFSNMSQTEHILGPLDPFTCYFSYIRVRTDAGWGENSDFASEITMSSAPSGPPINVNAAPIVEESKAAAIKVSFDSPVTPNGVITRYKVFYQTLPDGPPFHKEIRVQGMHNTITLENVFYYSNYSIQVSACVDQACSEKSQPVNVYTGISHPGIVELPRVELLGDFLNITWEAPHFPNGPAQFYQVRMLNNDTDLDEVFNVTRQKYFVLDRECTNGETDLKYSFKVRAVNFKDGLPLFGEYSGSVNTVVCPSGFLTGYNAGLLVGVVIGFIVLVSVISYLIRYFHRNINEAKKTQIKLPKGLESPLDNPLSSYDKFKSGLQNSRDAGIPNDRAYDRLFSSSDGDLKTDSVIPKRKQTDRNPSGTSSNNGQESANTTKTQDSLDSGTEVESPPSPDSFCSNDAAIATSRQRNKSEPWRAVDAARTSNINRSNESKDSGLVKDERQIHGVTNLTMTSRGRCLDYKLSKKGTKFPHLQTSNGSSISPSVSEPSVAEYDLGDGSEPLVQGGMPPYCKFHMSTSAGHGLNAVNEPHYSKFGGPDTFYRPLMSYRRVVPPQQHIQVFSAMPIMSRNVYNPDPTDLFPQKKKDIQRTHDNPDITPPNGYMSISDAIKSANGGGGPSHTCELPGQLADQDGSDAPLLAPVAPLLAPVAVTSSGYVPVDISYPEITNESPEPEIATVEVDLSEMLPSNFAIVEQNGDVGPSDGSCKSMLCRTDLAKRSYRVNYSTAGDEFSRTRNR
ncbi:hypothetical protein JTE90_002458 [Oedothorax gibbosus]|nr:hypothetical protein JTE90_002458 [Oedothorax gibbosus]